MVWRGRLKRRSRPGSSPEERFPLLHDRLTFEETPSLAEDFVGDSPPVFGVCRQANGFAHHVLGIRYHELLFETKLSHLHRRGQMNTKSTTRRTGPARHARVSRYGTGLSNKHSPNEGTHTQ